MSSIKKILAIVVIVLGVANITLGITFITIGASKQQYLHGAMDGEQITLELSDEQIAAGEVVDTSAEALAVASFGLTTVAIGAGVGMLLAGIAFAIVGALWLFWRRKAEPSAA